MQDYSRPAVSDVTLRQLPSASGCLRFIVRDKVHISDTVFYEKKLCYNAHSLSWFAHVCNAV